MLEDAKKLWLTMVRKNRREKIVDRGQVPYSQMDEIDEDELVSGIIELRAGKGSKTKVDPLVGRKEFTEQKKEEWFGGYEVYIAVDLSGSTNDEIGGVKKVETERDMVFLITDSCMSAATLARKKITQLKSPMPVKVSVVVFGERIEIVLPLTETWGPAAQIRIYRALDRGAGGGTPDHEALAMIGEQIKQGKEQETTMLNQSRSDKRRVMQANNWHMRRFVLVVADGGSDKPTSVQQEVKALEQAGIPVDLFLIASEDNKNLLTAAQGAYGSVMFVPDPADLADKGLARLTERINAAYKRN